MMAVVLDKANVVLVDKDGNRATVTSLTDNDLAKLSVGLSDVDDLKTRVKAVEDNGYVSYNSMQVLDEGQCAQAQANMDAPGLSVNNTFTGNITVEANVKADSMTLNTRSDYAKLSASTNAHGIKLLGGSSDTTGASVDLRGSTDTDAPNTFTVSASSGVALKGDKDGALTWNSENVVRKVNNIPADASGNVLLGTEKSTFNKVVYDTGYFSISTLKTYNFDLTGTDLENVSKENINIRLVAKVTTAHGGFEVGDIAQLTPTVDYAANAGTLDICSYIRGNTLYFFSGGDRAFSIYSGTGWLLKENVQIKAVLTAFIPDDGSILLIAEDQTNTSKLIGLPDGTLTWNDKNIVRSVNNVRADTNGNVTDINGMGSSGLFCYVKFSNGLALLWGRFLSKNTLQTYNFPFPLIARPVVTASYQQQEIQGSGSDVYVSADLVRFTLISVNPNTGVHVQIMGFWK